MGFVLATRTGTQFGDHGQGSRAINFVLFHFDGRPDPPSRPRIAYDMARNAKPKPHAEPGGLARTTIKQNR